MKINFADQLNPEQAQVVTGGDGPCLVLAGPGSGKTRTLVHRVAYLLNRKIPPSEVLILTFTNKASREMLRRVEILFGRYPAGLVGGTFHHVGNISLRRYAESIGYTRTFTILDRTDSRDLVGEVLEELKLGKERYFPKPDIISDIIGFATNSCQELETVIRNQYPYFEKFTAEIQRAAIAYQAKKKTTNAMDYDDLLSNWLHLLLHNPSAREFYQEKFRYVLVDEYQDTNRLQFEILKVLAQKHRNIMVVGDDGQSIYSFRAAELKNILQFPESFPGTRIFRLETNYRSVPEILRLANESIKHNQNQFPKTLKSIRETGPKPILVSAEDGAGEARFVSRRILSLVSEENIPLSEIAVLFRARYQATQMEMELTGRGIPYLVRGGLRFYEQAHVKDILAYLKVLVNERDELAWRRILLQVEGIGAGYFRRVWERIGWTGSPLKEFVNAKHLPVAGRSQKPVLNLQQLLRRLSGPEVANQPAGIIKGILEGDYRQYCLATYADGPERIMEIEELVKIAAVSQSTERFLSETIMGETYKGETVLAATDNEKALLTLSTIHQAKGLEWQVVFLIGLADNRFPHSKSAGNPERLEEERRLFYVAVTRAKNILYLTQPILSYGWGENLLQRLSPFVRELPESTYDKELPGN